MFNSFSVWGHSMPIREKFAAMRRTWPLMLKAGTGNGKTAAKELRWRTAGSSKAGVIAQRQRAALRLQEKTSELTIPPRKSRVPALCRVSSAPAQVVKLVDTLASGASGRKAVEVQVLSWAPFPKQRLAMQDHTADPPSYECRERVSCVEGPQG